MNFLRLVLDKYYGDYSLDDATDLKMTILGRFFSSDVGCQTRSFRNFALDNEATSTNSNVTYLEKENHFILLGDLYSEEDKPTELKMTQQQFVQLLDEWQEKVCKRKPKTIIIKHENDQFIIETSDED